MSYKNSKSQSKTREEIINKRMRNQWAKFDTMRPIILLGSMLVIMFSSLGQDLEVIVKNVKDGNGVLMVGLFASEKTFTKQPIKALKPMAQAGVMKVSFQDVPIRRNLYLIQGSEYLENQF